MIKSAIAVSHPLEWFIKYIDYSKMDASKLLWREKRIEVAKALILKDSNT
jgi:hypothetical protein